MTMATNPHTALLDIARQMVSGRAKHPAAYVSHLQSTKPRDSDIRQMFDKLLNNSWYHGGCKSNRSLCSLFDKLLNISLCGTVCFVIQCNSKIAKCNFTFFYLNQTMRCDYSLKSDQTMSPVFSLDCDKICLKVYSHWMKSPCETILWKAAEKYAL